MRKSIGLCLLFVMLSCGSLYAKTLILEGRLNSRVQVTQQIGFSVDRPLSKLTFKFALPSAFSNKTVSQETLGLNLRFDPQPVSVEDASDNFGNRFKIAVWNNLDRNVRLTLTFETHIKSELSAMESKALLPLKSIPQSEAVYLRPTAIVQSNSPEITALAKKLTANASAEHEAVTAILNYVADNVKYTYNPPQFDALYTLKTKSGNCQNFAHLNMALLRAVGIPARIVGGISLKQPLKVPVGNNDYLVQSLGQGGHAWMEIYFPDLGWLSYDPQQSKQFTSSRHIKQTHGLDSDDINDNWRGAPYLPEYSETVNAKFVDDVVSLKMRSSERSPRAYLLSNNFLTKAEVKPYPTYEKPKLPPGRLIEFGNMDFPGLVNIYQIVGDKGVRILDKETAEYVTSNYVYAQAFEIDEKLNIDKISLAMRKFGGDGTVYVDLVSDENGRPGFEGMRSVPLFLENIKRMPGYYWVDFTFPEKAVLKKGRYWIVLRHSGEVIMNWFYIPGNPYADSDDTRSTLKGHRWEDIQNYDFVFKIKAGRN
ncbi:MAG TPA: transglutaminase [Nitrospiraceae bacterium]|nr:MAG: transglutaminase [Nitrospirae bacterium GWA2_46_11]HAK89021.1 transglutaminase [Nitrospiraceae bacterium]